MRKKIGIDGRLWYESGVGRYIRNMVLGLDKLNDNKSDFTIFLESKAFKVVNFKSPNITKVEANVRWHTLSEQWKFKRIIERENLDLMHFTYFSYPVFYRKPFVITIHDLIIDHFPTGKASSLPLPLYSIKRFGYKKITQKAVENSEKIIVPSVATKNEIVSLYSANSSKIAVIYEGFDTLINKSRAKKLDNNKRYILYVGNAYPHKNLQNLIRAFEKLREKHNIELICIGRDDFFYKKIECKTYDGVRFLHNIDDEALFRYYTNAICLVVPSLMEGFGLPLLEAMSLSCPVVCSNIKSLKEIGRDAVLYFEPNNIDDISLKIEQVLKDDKLVKDLIKKGEERSSQFSWEKNVSQTLKLYESCVGLRQGE